MNNNEIIKHAKAIKEYCEGRGCNGCIFHDIGCAIGYSNPVSWIIPKPQILDKKEKEYLSNVIRPFRGKVRYITKTIGQKEFIRIILKGADSMDFPYLSNKKMYQGMKRDKQYTLEELGL